MKPDVKMDRGGRAYVLLGVRFVRSGFDVVAWSAYKLAKFLQTHVEKISDSALFKSTTKTDGKNTTIYSDVVVAAAAAGVVMASVIAFCAVAF